MNRLEYAIPFSTPIGRSVCRIYRGAAAQNQRGDEQYDCDVVLHGLGSCQISKSQSMLWDGADRPPIQRSLPTPCATSIKNSGLSAKSLMNGLPCGRPSVCL